MAPQTPKLAGLYVPPGWPPPPVKLATQVLGLYFWSISSRKTSSPTSRFLTGFQMVRTPIPQTLKLGLQPGVMTPVEASSLAPEAGFMFGLTLTPEIVSQKASLAVLSKLTAVNTP